MTSTDPGALPSITAASLASIEGLQALGFEGFATVTDLARSNCLEVPVARGVYVVVREPADPPRFMPGSAAGTFRGQKPHVKVEVLEKKWVPGAIVLYVGQAGGTGVRGQLQQRIKRRIRFGSGKSVAAWGGRYVWQLADHRSHRFGWKECEDPLGWERRLLDTFKRHYGALPFANLKEELLQEETEE